MPINESYSKMKSTKVFNFDPMNAGSRLSEKTNKLSSSSSTESNCTISNGNSTKLFYPTFTNESPTSGSTTIKINTASVAGNRSKISSTPINASKVASRFRSENLLNTGSSVSDKIMSRVLHTTSSRDSGKICKRSSNEKSKKMSAFSVQCYNLAEKERYRQLIDNNMCTMRAGQAAGRANCDNYYQNYVQTAPIEIKDDNTLGFKYTKLPNLNEKVELPVSSQLTGGVKQTSALASFTRRGSRLSTNSSNSIISLSSVNGSSSSKGSSKDNNKEDIMPPLVTNEKKAPSQPAASKSLLSSRLIAPTRKIMRQLTDYELKYDNRLQQNNGIIESLFKPMKDNLKYQVSSSLSEEEHKFNLLKRRRKEDEAKLAKEFAERLQLNVNKLPQYYFEEEVVDEEFPELTDEQQRLITNSLISYPEDEILAKGFNIDVRRKDLQTLKGLNWLNDEVINFYMNLISHRSETTDLRVYPFQTFFYPRLIKDGYTGVKRWTKKIDIFAYNVILVPIHLGLHWTLSVIDMTNKEIRYYDSMNGHNNECLKALKNYVRDEHLDKKGKSIDLTQWNALHVQDIPQQMNGSDCGMFTCKYAEFISRGKTTFSFNQSHMPYYRRRMIYEIVTKQLL